MSLWHGEVVELHIADEVERYSTEATNSFRFWLFMAHIGLGVLLWGLFGWWDGLFMLGYRTFAWMFMSFMPIDFIGDSLAYGLGSGTGPVMGAFGSVMGDVVLIVFLSGGACFMLISSLGDW